MCCHPLISLTFHSNTQTKHEGDFQLTSRITAPWRKNPSISSQQRMQRVTLGTGGINVKRGLCWSSIPPYYGLNFLWKVDQNHRHVSVRLTLLTASLPHKTVKFISKVLVAPFIQKGFRSPCLSNAAHWAKGANCAFDSLHKTLKFSSIILNEPQTARQDLLCFHNLYLFLKACVMKGNQPSLPFMIHGVCVEFRGGLLRKLSALLQRSYTLWSGLMRRVTFHTQYKLWRVQLWFK